MKTADWRDESVFMREVIRPTLQRLSEHGRVLFNLDPLNHFARYNTLADRAVRTLATTWFKGVCRQGATCLITDHPSVAGLEAGRHYSGSAEKRNAFPNFSTLVVDGWQGLKGNRQRKLTWQGMRNRYGIEQRIVLYAAERLSPVLTLDAAPGLSPEDLARKVYPHIIERLNQGKLTTNKDNGQSHGPAAVGVRLEMDPHHVRLGMETCLLKSWLVYRPARGNDPAGFARGVVTPLPAELIVRGEYEDQSDYG